MSGFLARARRHVGFQIGAVLLLLFVGTALVSLFWTPYPVDELADALQAAAVLGPASGSAPTISAATCSRASWSARRPRSPSA